MSFACSRTLRLFCGVAIGLSAILFAHAQVGADELWSEDAASAIEVAKQADRDLLLFFTGSDWCPPCIQLEANVLSQAEFGEQAPSQFVLVMFDFPRNSEQAPELQAQNSMWAERYGIDSFPTIVLVDPQLRPYAFTGFREGDAAAYLEHLKQLQQARIKRDDALELAVGLQGLERAGMLDQAMSALDRDIAEVYYEDVINEIGELDSDDEMGLRTKYFAARDREMRKSVMSEISMVARIGKPEHALQLIDLALASVKLPIDMQLEAKRIKLRLLRKLDRNPAADALLDEMIATPEISHETRQRLITKKVFYLTGTGQSDRALAELEEYIKTSPENLLLYIAKGEMLDSLEQFELAIDAYDQSIVAAAAQPEVLIDVIGAKADALVALDRVPEALSTLDQLIENENVMNSVRAEALLHKALILRETGRRRAATLAENRAVEIVETPEEKGEIQKLVDQFRRKFANAGDSDGS